MSTIKWILLATIISFKAYSQETISSSQENSFTGHLRFANEAAAEGCQVRWESASATSLTAQLKSFTSPELSRFVNVKVQNQTYKIQTPDFSQNFNVSLNSSYIAKYTQKFTQENDTLSAVYNVVLNTQRQEFVVYMQVLLKTDSGQTAISAQKRILLCK